MKIVYVCNSIIPSRTANSIHVMKMCQAFAKNGHEVILLTTDRKNKQEKNVNGIYEFYGVERCFQIKKLISPNIKGKAAIYSLAALRILRDFKPDIFYGRVIFGCAIAAMKGIPTIFEAHAPIWQRSKAELVLFKELIKRKNFQKLIVISQGLKNICLEQMDLDEERIEVAHDGADEVTDFKPVPNCLGRKDALQVGYTGHLYEGRGIELIGKLAAHCPWADFHLIGGDDKDIAYWNSKLGRMTNIMLHGFVPPSEIEGYRQRFDVALSPYQRKVSVFGGGNTVKWMSPLKIFEYMASGKAIICSDLQVLREVVCHERTALLCNPDSFREWVEALVRLRDDPVLRKRLGAKARERFLEYYTWQARASRVIDGLR